MKIKAKDTVKVITGKDAGKTGLVMRTIIKKNRVVVKGVNKITKHIKPTSTRKGEIIRYESPIDVSNVLLVCPSCSKVTRVGYKLPQTKDAKKIRICKKCNNSVEQEQRSKKS